jgi:NSS family neurotransmitter:Na+ symporter
VVGSTESGGIRASLHGQWSSRLAFILAVTGSAVGLGNIWKFPYVAGENGGGAFVLVYLACVFLIGLPIMVSEILLGRRGRRNPMHTFAILGEEEGSTRHWRLVGAMGILAGFLILSFYSVIAGWSVAYIFESVSGAFGDGDAETISAIFGGLTGSWLATGFWHTVFLVMTVFIVARGVEKGLEQAVRFMVPALLAIMLVLLVYALTSGHFMQGVRFLFEPDFSKLGPGSVLAALGQAFFTLSLGMGALMAYGAYLPRETSIGSTAVVVVIADTSVALLSGLVIFPLVFANGLSPGEGPGLIFLTLPAAFAQMPAGLLFGTLFFILLSFAAWTSAIGLIEPAVAWLVERKGYSRPLAAVMVGGAGWAFGWLTVLSFNVLGDVTFGRGTVFDNIDHLASNILLPLGGLFIVIFAAWVMRPSSSREELAASGDTAYGLWRLLARFLAPVAVVLVFLNAVGVI